MATLNDIYKLLPQDVVDFNRINALPQNSRGPQVSVMSYKNDSVKSSVKMNITGTPNALITYGFMFTDNESINIWRIPFSIKLDENGQATSLYVQCDTFGAIDNSAGTLTNMLTVSPDVLSITNPYNTVLSNEEFLQCVDKSTIDNPDYQQWADAMENNQPISTREVVTITMG